VYVRYQTLMKIYIMQSEYRPTRRQGSIGGGGEVLGEAGRWNHSSNKNTSFGLSSHQFTWCGRRL